MDKNRYYIEPCARKSDRKTPNARQQVLPNRYGAGFSDTPPREDFAIRKYLKKFFFFLFPFCLKSQVTEITLADREDEPFFDELLM